MTKILAVVLAAVKKLHKLARVLVRVQFSYDRTYKRVGKPDTRGIYKTETAPSWVLKVHLGAGAGYMWPRFFEISGRCFFIAWRAKNYHFNPRQFSTPLCVRLTSNGNDSPVPDGVGYWKTLDLF